MLLSSFSPGTPFHLCGVSLNKRPGLYGHMLEYLRGCLIGIPAAMKPAKDIRYINACNSNCLIIHLEVRA